MRHVFAHHPSHTELDSIGDAFARPQLCLLILIGPRLRAQPRDYLPVITRLYR